MSHGVKVSVPVRPPPLVPTGLAANAVSTTQINLSWNATTDPGGPGVKDYGLYRNGVLVTYVAGLFFSDTGLTASTTYPYQVSARDLALVESGLSPVVNGTTQASGGAAVGFTPNAALSVSASGTFADGQTVTINLPGGGFGALADARPLLYFPFETNLSTHPTLSRVSATMTPINGNTVIQTTVKPVNSAGAVSYIPIANGSFSLAFSTSPWGTMPGGAGSKLYSFMKRRWDFFVAGTPTMPDNCKMWRYWPQAGVGQNPDVYFAWSGPNNEFVGASEGNVNFTGGTPSNGHFVPMTGGLQTWKTDEYWWKENTYPGTSGTADGIHQWARFTQMAYPMTARWYPCATNNPSAGNPTGAGPITLIFGDQYTVNTAGQPPNGSTDKAFWNCMVMDTNGFNQLYATDEGTTLLTAMVGVGGADHLREWQPQVTRTDTQLTAVIRQGEHVSLVGKNLLFGDPYGAQFNLGVFTAPAFDFYISTAGDDNNAGTLAAPWSITALNAPAKRALYAGKRVGLLPGTYTQGTVGGVNTSIYSIINGKTSQQFVGLSIQGGTAGFPTYLASCDAGGLYRPRTATVNPGNPSGGLPPNYGSTTASPGVIGQGSTDTTAIPNGTFGNLVIDGINVTNAYGEAISCYAGGFTGPGGATGLIIKNCEVYNCSGYENQNIACLFTYFYTGALLQNNKLHDCVPFAGGNQGLWDASAILTQECLNNVYEYNTIYNCNCSIYDKNTTQGSTYRYNYLENVGTFRNTNLEDCAGGASGSTMSAYNNIMVGPTGIWAANAFHQPAIQSFSVYNNTIFYAGGTWAGEGGTGSYLPTSGGTSKVSFYNNIVACAANGAPTGDICYCVGGVAISDYNAVQGTSAGGGVFLESPTSSPQAFTYYALAAWQAHSGLDTNTIQLSLGTFFPSWQSITAGGASSQFKTVPAAVSTLGRIGGIPTGAVIPAGAWGGTDVSLYNGQPITQIGSNF
jgi:chitodextrinase